ncbi:hypothetical protein [Psychroflexus lacisalsi]|jgi:hypothetical protein|uniref:Uncharacterized protein n=1 Tax=Psychroflexus lacisalsi TaxID=503928 RepID=A0ABP3VM13_9FLAO|nr:hypothetical protein [Psychroflexus lacisalsi]MBZ9620150.1 hypothetical protein [Psychroflexus lacisalsi]
MKNLNSSSNLGIYSLGDLFPKDLCGSLHLWGSLHMNLNELQDFLYNTNIPEEKTQIGFLEIAGKAHHENTNSVVYAHFMNSNNKDVKILFLSSLVEIIK